MFAMFGSGNCRQLKSSEVVMTKKSVQPRTGVSTSRKASLTATAAAQARDTHASASVVHQQIDAAPSVSVSLSARYIDSRMKQFCLR